MENLTGKVHLSTKPRMVSTRSDVVFFIEENPPVRSESLTKIRSASLTRGIFSLGWYVLLLSWICFLGWYFHILNQHVSPPFAEYVFAFSNHRTRKKSSNKNGCQDWYDNHVWSPENSWWNSFSPGRAFMVHLMGASSGIIPVTVISEYSNPCL